ncbi:MAG: hypothetical protein OHK0022_22220 [Roseiflexaceae bacterium]
MIPSAYPTPRIPLTRYAALAPDDGWERTDTMMSSVMMVDVGAAADIDRVPECQDSDSSMRKAKTEAV